MENSKFKKLVILLGVTNIVTLVVFGVSLGKGNLFQGRVELEPRIHEAAVSPSHCKTVKILSLPDGPLPANKSAMLRLKVEPENFEGAFSFSTSSGTFNDLAGNVGSLIATTEHKVSFSGGEADATITVQAQGAGNEQCIATLGIVSPVQMKCASLKLDIYPSPLPPNQSAEIKIIPVPANFSGNFLMETESGKLQISNADSEADGNNTNILISNSKTVLYNGGKPGETIRIRALGQQNSACDASIQINKEN